MGTAGGNRGANPGVFTGMSVAGSDRNDRDRKLVYFTYLRDVNNRSLYRGYNPPSY